MQTPRKQIAILGATGSIGVQALDILSQHPERFGITALTAAENVQLLIEQSLRYRPQLAAIANPAHYAALRDALAGSGIRVAAGEEAIAEAASLPENDMVLTALVGFAGLRPTLAAIRQGKHIALANKETLVVAGELVNEEARRHGVEIIPVDSEHSALFQCIVGETGNPVEKIYLTASGGPFRGMKTPQLRNVSAAQALKHPNWEMGAKITIDSASMMNKGLEVIEAKWLFGLRDEQIDVIVHPQSIIHSIVQFEDSSMKAQMGLPDMRVPIVYALSYPTRLACDIPRFDFLKYPTLSFETPDYEAFGNLGLAFEAMRRGGTAPCALNAANEISNLLFRQGKIGFLDIAALNEKAMETHHFLAHPGLEDLFETDMQVRRYVQEAAGHYEKMKSA